MSNGTKEVGCSKEELTVVASINPFEGKIVGVTCGSPLYIGDLIHSLGLIKV